MPNPEDFGPQTEQDYCNDLVRAINATIGEGIGKMPSMGAKIALACGCAIPPLSILALALGKERPGATSFAKTESTVFAAFYLICSLEDYGNGMICGFTPETVTKAQAMYKMVMGRDYTDIHPVLLQMMEERVKEAQEAAPDRLKKFVQN